MNKSIFWKILVIVGITIIVATLFVAYLTLTNSTTSTYTGLYVLKTSFPIIVVGIASLLTGIAIYAHSYFSLLQSKKVSKNARAVRSRAFAKLSIASFLLAAVSAIGLQRLKQAVCEKTVYSECTVTSDFQFNLITVIVFVVFLLAGGITYMLSRR